MLRTQDLSTTKMSEEHTEDAITNHEIAGTATPKFPSESKSAKERNACRSFSPNQKPFDLPFHLRLQVTELMDPKRKSHAHASSSTSNPAKRMLTGPSKFPGRDGLGAYIAHPEAYSSSRVLYYNADFVVINDMYPKSSVHTLLLPRSAKCSLVHPFDAFEDPEFLAAVKEETRKLKQLVASELRRMYGSFSKTDAVREAILNGEVELAEGEEMPAGRDWERDVMAGVHAHPSMNHLHVHVLSVDRYSECLKHRRHYNSFSTEFFVPLEAFPLARDDPRRTEGYLQRNFLCWRCGKNFGNHFARLKEHLAVEFEAWKTK